MFNNTHAEVLVKPAAGIVSGPIDKVPCAHCGTPMDLTELVDHIEVGSSLGDSLDRGQKIACDRCNKNSQVVQVRRVTFISVRQS